MWRAGPPLFKSEPSEKPFWLSGIWEATMSKPSADTNAEVAPALTGSGRMPHLSPTEVHHGWVCGSGLPHCHRSRLPIKQEVCGLTSQGAGESGHW